MDRDHLPYDGGKPSLIGDEALAADYVDLFLTPDDRERGVLLLVLCDAEGRVLGAHLIHDLPDNPDGVATRTLAQVSARLGGRVLLAVGHRWPARYVPWLHALSQAVARESGHPPLGVFLAPAAGAIVPVPAEAA